MILLSCMESSNAGVTTLKSTFQLTVIWFHLSLNKEAYHEEIYFVDTVDGTTSFPVPLFFPPSRAGRRETGNEVIDGTTQNRIVHFIGKTCQSKKCVIVLSNLNNVLCVLHRFSDYRRGKIQRNKVDLTVKFKTEELVDLEFKTPTCMLKMDDVQFETDGFIPRGSNYYSTLMHMAAVPARE